MQVGQEAEIELQKKAKQRISQCKKRMEKLRDEILCLIFACARTSNYCARSYRKTIDVFLWWCLRIQIHRCTLTSSSCQFCLGTEISQHPPPSPHPIRETCGELEQGKVVAHVVQRSTAKITRASLHVENNFYLQPKKIKKVIQTNLFPFCVLVCSFFLNIV